MRILKMMTMLMLVSTTFATPALAQTEAPQDNQEAAQTEGPQETQEATTETSEESQETVKPRPCPKPASRGLQRSYKRMHRRLARRTRVGHSVFYRPKRCAPTRKRLVREIKRLRRVERKLRFQIPASARSVLRPIAGCESGHNPRAVGGGGTYRGLFQFDFTTWGSVGGSGDPINASVREQYYRAWKLYKMRGSSPWPVCG